MTIKRVFVRGFFMDFIIFLLILQTCSLVQTIEVQTGQIKDEKLIGKASTVNVTTNVPDTIKYELSNEPEFRIVVESFNHEDLLPELYDEIQWMKRFSTEKDELITTPIIGQLDTNAEKGLDILKIPDENNHFNRSMLRIENENLTTFMNLIPSEPESDEKNVSSIKYNSTTLRNALYQSLISNAWTHYLEPLLQIAAAKPLSNSTNITKNATKKNFDHIKIGQRQDKLPTVFHNQTNNATTIALKTLLEAHIGLLINNTLTSNKSNDSISSISPNLSTAQSMHSRIQNASGNIKDSTITNDPKIRMTNTNKSQPTNDSLIFEIDTTASSSMETMITPQTQQSNPVQNIKNGAVRSSLQLSKNSTINDNLKSINITTTLQENNNTKIRPPYSARYSRIHKPASTDRKIQKREVGFNSDSNTAQRQELASYFYNEQKIRENYPTYIKPPGDDGNFPLNIYNTDGINEGGGIDIYPFQALYVRNLDGSPPEELFDDALNFNSNMTQNLHTDINDSSLLYLADKLGYSIIDDTVMTTTTKEIITENGTIYSTTKSPIHNNITEKKQEKNSARKNSAAKRNGHKSKSKSKKSRKSRTRGTRKNKKNGRKSSVKSTKRRNNKKSKSNSSKYSRNRTNHKNNSNTQNALKKKRKASITRLSNRDES